MTGSKRKPPVLDPASLEPRIGAAIPEPLRSKIGPRERRVLGDPLGLKNFGVNLVRLPPGARSALRHWHARQDEFVYVVSGSATLVTDAGRTQLAAGQCAGFPAGVADGHCLINEGTDDVVYLEVGDRTPGDAASYPEDDLTGAAREIWNYTRKDGKPL